MPKFFVDASKIDRENGKIRIEGDDAFHISRSLRMAPGEKITVSDGGGSEFLCSLESFSDTLVVASVCEEKQASNEPPFAAYVYQGLPKGDKLDTVIQKATECGACGVIPFESEFCIAKSKPDAEEGRTARRRRIALEAAKQCKRDVVPEIKKTIGFDEMLEDAAKCDVVLFCYEGEGTRPLGCWLSPNEFKISDGKRPTVAIVVGPEGGFSQKEVEKAVAKNFKLTGLGKRILRTETAASFVLSCLVCAFELGGTDF